ncbi:MAG: PBP1A family penicillin-binding protein [Mariprofundaceae bacterium]
MRTVFLMLKVGIIFIIISVTAITGIYLYFASNLPKLSSLESYQPALVSRIYNFDGQLLAEYAEEHRILTPFEDMPRMLVNAFLAAEDEYFYSHPGINPPRILAAAIANFRAGRTVQGGSTITQQVAKNFLLTAERTYTRKIREMILAYRIEETFSKDEILYLYLNHIYLGRGAYGVASAAWRYFHKHLDELTLAECAMLAGLPKAPSYYAPHLYPERALTRRNIVLNMMVRSSYVSPDEGNAAIAEPLEVAPLPANRLSNAYANSIYNKLARQFGSETLRRQGLTIFIPYKPELEEAAVRSLRKGVLAAEKRQYYRAPRHHEQEAWETLLAGWAEARNDDPPRDDEILPALIEDVSENGDLLVNDGHNYWLLSKPKWRWKLADDDERPRTWVVGDEIILQGDGKGGVHLAQTPSIEAALYSIDLQRGTVLASVGGFDYKLGDFDRSTQAQRQPGSAFKPFLYAKAMDAGYTPATTIMDTPVVFENREQEDLWRPENYANRFVGAVTLRDALEHSRNLASIKLLQDIGITPFRRFLDNFQFNREFPSQLALALGATEASLEEMSESYGVLADKGRRWQPVWVQQVQDRNGKTLQRSVAGNRCQICHADPVLAVGAGMEPFEQTVDPVSSFLATNMLRGVIERGTGWRARQLKRPAAGKTGTTNDQVDAWFIGYTPQILTGVWVGRDSPVSMGRRETGSKAALPIWLSAMQEFHENLPVEDFSPPEGIEWVVVDIKTGKLADAQTGKPLLEAFRAGTAPTQTGNARTLPEQPEDDFYEMDL